MSLLRIIACAFVLLSLSGQCIQGKAQTRGPDRLNSDQKTWLAPSERHEKDGWIYLHIEGAPHVRGFQHGYRLATEIVERLRVQRAHWEYDSGMEWSWLIEQAKTLFDGKIGKELLEEINGIVEGVNAAGFSTTRDEIVAFNASIELSDSWWPEVKKAMGSGGPISRKQSCSSFIATGTMTADGGIVLGHNTMSGYLSADSYVIADIVPAKGHRILWQTTPGWVHSGTDFFITDAGLVGSETTIGKFNGFDTNGTPEFARMRRATQYASSIDEWCEIMKKENNGGYANAWLIGDIKTNEIARLELGLKYVGLERTKDGFFVGSNIAESQKILRLETEEHETDIRVSGVARRVRWKQLMREFGGKINVELAKAFEGDHYDSYLRTMTVGGRSLCAHVDRDSLDLDLPFSPEGTVDAKVVDSKMAKQMSFAARWGSGCGIGFDAPAFLERHPQFDWMKGYLKSLPSEPWTVFQAGEAAKK
jgi:hypothetical protein